MKNLQENMSNRLELTSEDYFHNQTDINLTRTSGTSNNRGVSSGVGVIVTQELTLSSSSQSDSLSTSNSISTSASPNSSVSSTPDRNNNVDQKLNILKHFEENGSNSTISNFDSGIEEPNKNNEINAKSLNTNIASLASKYDFAEFKKNFMMKRNTDASFTEVSYDFLSDLSQVNQERNNQKLKLTHSKSFNKKTTYANILQEKQQPTQSYNKKTLNNNVNEGNSSPSPTDFNPFRRSSISKSFSAFTTRLKQQASLRKKNMGRGVHGQNNKNDCQQHQKTDINDSSHLKNLFQNVERVKDEAKKVKISNEPLSTAALMNKKTAVNELEFETGSRGSSPTLSSCSYSSSNSSSHQLASHPQENHALFGSKQTNNKNNNYSDVIISL